MASTLESISRFVDTIGNQVSLTFKSIDDFIDLVVTFFVSLGFWTSVVVFFASVSFLLAIPLLFMRYGTSIKENLGSVLKSVTSYLLKR